MVVLTRKTQESLIVLQNRGFTAFVLTRKTWESLVVVDGDGEERRIEESVLEIGGRRERLEGGAAPDGPTPRRVAQPAVVAECPNDPTADSSPAGLDA